MRVEFGTRVFEITNIGESEGECDIHPCASQHVYVWTLKNDADAGYIEACFAHAMKRAADVWGHA